MASKTVYPVPGTYLMGVPAVPIVVDDETAARLVRTGAFTTDEPADAGDSIDAPAGITDALAFYDPPEPAPDTDGQEV